MGLSRVNVTYVYPSTLPQYLRPHNPLVRKPVFAHTCSMAFARGLVPGEYYHVYNRAARGRTLFTNEAEWARFLFGILYYQSPTPFTNALRLSKTFEPKSGFVIPDADFENVLRARRVELVAFCIMPNHFHLLVRELVPGGISRYVQRVELSYTKYFNTKYDTSGHVFQGRFQAKHIPDNEYLMHLSAYIHRNPRELKAWRGRETAYPWSSYQDYVEVNRWGGLLAQEVVLDQFDGTTRSNYADYIKTSPAKEARF